MTGPRPAWQASFELLLIIATSVLAMALARDVLHASIELDGSWILLVALLLGVVEGLDD